MKRLKQQIDAARDAIQSADFVTSCRATAGGVAVSVELVVDLESFRASLAIVESLRDEASMRLLRKTSAKDYDREFKALIKSGRDHPLVAHVCGVIWWSELIDDSGALYKIYKRLDRGSNAPPKYSPDKGEVAAVLAELGFPKKWIGQRAKMRSSTIKAADAKIRLKKVTA